MKRWIALLLAMLMLLGGCAPADNAPQDTPTPPAADQPIDKGEDPYVRLADGVTAEMLNADYWMKDAYKDVVMTAQEIDAYNPLANKLLYDHKGKAYALTDVQPRISGDLVRYYIDHDVPTHPERFFVNGAPTTRAFWVPLWENCRIDAIRDEATVLFGYSVKRATLKSWPTDTFIGEEADDTFYDANAASECMPYLPVCVLHESTDGQWYYCLMYGMRGWVRKDAIAICDSRDEWMMRQQQEECLVVTGKELRLAEDPLTPALSNLVLPMGTVLPLVSTDGLPDEINGRATFGNYVVLLPVRDTDGSLYNEYALIPVSADVHVGFLPYTRENVLRQAFKLLGDRYGWAGMFGANDCSGMVHEIVACFGLTFPRASVTQQQAPAMKRVDLNGKSNEEKTAILDKTPAGTLLYFPGHIMIYLGKADGNYYVISSVGTFVQNGNAEHVSNVIVNTLNTQRANGTTWLDNISAIQWVEPQ